MTPSKALLGYEAAKRGQWEIPAYNKQRQEKDNAKERRKIIRARQLDFNEEFPMQDQAPPVTFRRGEKVMVRENNPTGPFAPTWDGPYEVILRWSPQIYEVDKKGKQFRHHVDQLRPAPEGNTVIPEDLESDPENPQDNPNNLDVSYSEDEEPPQPIVTRAIVYPEPISRVEHRSAGTEVEPRQVQNNIRPSHQKRSAPQSTNRPSSLFFRPCNIESKDVSSHPETTTVSIHSEVHHQVPGTPQHRNQYSA